LADIYQMSFSQPFDAFWASAVLLHIPRHRINEALSRIRSVMKPGAIGFISIMDGQGENWRDEDGLPESRRYFTYWTKEAFSDALTASNFGLVAYQYRPQSQRTRWHCFYAKAE